MFRLTPLLALALGTGCTQPPAAAPSAKTAEVVATSPVSAEVTDYQDFTGRLDAVFSVDVRARVTGYVTEVPFKEGDYVHEGDLLFQIDPRTYAADLNQAEANLVQAESERNLQNKNVLRAQELIRSRSMSKEDYDTALAAVQKASATVGSMQAARDRAKLYVDYTRVTAPIAGRVSRRYVDPGNLVNADMTLLTSIVTEDPLFAYFDVDERTYLDLLTSAGGGSAGQKSWLSGARFPVLMRLSNQEQYAQAGVVNFVDNRVNATTGTVRMRGVFQNPTGTLKPGLFVRIRLPVGRPYKAFAVPDEAIQSDQGHQYVYVIDKDDKVVYRGVQLGQVIDGVRVIKPPEKGKEGKEGLAGDERVMVTGMQRVRPGAAVKVTTQPPPKPPVSPLGKLLTVHDGKLTMNPGLDIIPPPAVAPSVGGPVLIRREKIAPARAAADAARTGVTSAVGN